MLCTGCFLLFRLINPEQQRLSEAIDGSTEIKVCYDVRLTGMRPPDMQERPRWLSRQLWFSEQLVFKASNEARGCQ